jgi:predicted nuclease of predicted toxin-antitoxin system
MLDNDDFIRDEKPVIVSNELRASISYHIRPCHPWWAPDYSWNAHPCVGYSRILSSRRQPRNTAGPVPGPGGRGYFSGTGIRKTISRPPLDRSGITLRFVVDAMLPRDLAEYLIALGHEASTVKRLRLGADETIWQYAEKYQAVVITKDSDYLPFPSSHSTAQLIHFTGGNMTTKAMIERFATQLPQIIEALLAGEKTVEIR